MSASPRELVARLEAAPALPPGTDERFNGYGVMGLPFTSGHVLALRRFPAAHDPFADGGGAAGAVINGGARSRLRTLTAAGVDTAICSGERRSLYGRGHPQPQEAPVKLSIKAFAWTGGICWGLSVFVVAVLNQIWPRYGVVFLDLERSLYPGYAAMSGFAGVIVGTVYAFVDGAVCFGILAWIYNKILGSGSATAA